MASQAAAVLVASASSVAKVYVICAVGYLGTKYPKDAPYIPLNQVGMLSRISFNLWVGLVIELNVHFHVPMLF